MTTVPDPLRVFVHVLRRGDASHKTAADILRYVQLRLEAYGHSGHSGCWSVLADMDRTAEEFFREEKTNEN